jgi:hypothetical protein
MVKQMPKGAQIKPEMAARGVNFGAPRKGEQCHLQSGRGEHMVFGPIKRPLNQPLKYINGLKCAG